MLIESEEKEDKIIHKAKMKHNKNRSTKMKKRFQSTVKKRSIKIVSILIFLIIESQINEETKENEYGGEEEKSENIDFEDDEGIIFFFNYLM